MKLNEIKPLDEASLKNLAAAGALGLGLASAPAAAAAHHHAPHAPKHPHHVQHHKQVQAKDTIGDILTQHISERYKISKELAHHIVKTAEKYQKPVFPKAADILAVVGVESSFDPNKKSGLKWDPAIGLMQVRPLTNKISPQELATIEGQIAHGANILDRYYKQFGTKDGAIQAYNVGETNYRHQTNLNPEYVRRVNQERQDILLSVLKKRPLVTI